MSSLVLTAENSLSSENNVSYTCVSLVVFTRSVKLDTHIVKIFTTFSSTFVFEKPRRFSLLHNWALSGQTLKEVENISIVYSWAKAYHFYCTCRLVLKYTLKILLL